MPAPQVNHARIEAERELLVFKTIYFALEPLSQEGRNRVMRSVYVLLGIEGTPPPSPPAGQRRA